MRRAVFLICFAALSLLPSVGSQEKPVDKPPAAVSVPTSGPRLEFLDEVSFYEQRFERLADAVPAEKYNWRPAEGVRTVGEVYTHVVTSNYGYAKMLGTPLPAGYDAKALTASPNDKAKTLQLLKDSFAQMRTAILAIKDADLEKEVKTPRGQTTLRGTFFMISGHYGEHLGQSVAYARSVGIVPPWTEERQKQQEAEKPEKPEKPKP